MTIGERIKELRTKQNMTQEELAKLTGYKSRSSINKIEIGERDIMQSVIVAFAKALNTTPAILMGWEQEPSETNVSEIITDNIYNIPVFESVSAGFGAYACSDIVEYMPLYINNAAEVPDTIAVKVKGDSMYPKIENGDIIVVRKQKSVDSGAIAVVLLDGEEAFVKKVEYGDTWINLISINPEYPIKHYEGEDVLRLKVIGLVKKIVKNL